MREPRTSQWILPLPRYEERGPRSTADCSGGYYYGPAHMSAEVPGDVWATLLVASEVAPASPEPALEVCAALWERWWLLRSHKPAQTNNPELLAVSGAAGSKAPVSPETTAVEWPEKDNITSPLGSAPVRVPKVTKLWLAVGLRARETTAHNASTTTLHADARERVAALIGGASIVGVLGDEGDTDLIEETVLEVPGTSGSALQAGPNEETGDVPAAQNPRAAASQPCTSPALRRASSSALTAVLENEGIVGAPWPPGDHIKDPQSGITN
uniref:Uncharacterized protein n=1 Tax=Knipowitschia caucasica TaxID=637954 RepID=A0AAV2MIE3_KNICA